jgi:hypothetical protein
MKKISWIIGFCLALLLPSMAFAQGAASPVTIINGNSPIGSANPLPTGNITPETQASLPFTNGQPLSLLVYSFGSGTLNTFTQWNRPTTGGGGNATAATNAVGQTTIGCGTLASGYSLLQTQRTIWERNPGYNYFQTNVNIPVPAVQNCYALFGFATVPSTPTAAAPATNAAAFEFGINGKLSAVTFASGSRQLVADLSVAQTNVPVQGATVGTYTGGCSCTPQITAAKSGNITDSYKYVIVFRGDNILWYIEQPTGALGLVAYTTRGAVGLDVNQVPITYLMVANTSVPSASATMQINQVTVGDTGKNPEPGFDRSVFPTQALTAVNDAVGVNSMGAGSCTFTTVSNTNVTLVFESTDANGSNWVSTLAYPQNGGSPAQTVPSGTNGQWTVPCGAMNQVRMRVSAIGATPTVLGTAEASVAPFTATNVAGQYFTNVTGSVLTRPADTTAYVANETVCLLKSITPCAPGTIAIANTNAGKGLINRVTLLKSGTTTASANFTIWLFSAAPVLTTPTQFDSTSYTGPRAADMPNYIGNATCNSPVATSDTTAQVWYDCTLSNPNTSGALDFQSLSGSTSINYLITVTAAYTPVSAETFTPYVSGLY